MNYFHFPLACSAIAIKIVYVIIFFLLFLCLFYLSFSLPEQVLMFFAAYGSLILSMQSYEKALKADPSFKRAADCLAIVLTDIGTSLKLGGNTQEGIQKYYEALKVDPHYAVSYFSILFLLLVSHLPSLLSFK